MIGVGYISPTTNRLTFHEEAGICTEFDVFIKEKVERHNLISNEWDSWMYVFRFKRCRFCNEARWTKNSVCVNGKSAMIAARKTHVAAHTTMK